LLIFGIAGIVVGIIGLAFALRCYVELYRWAKLLQGGRIAIARKGRVRLQAPLTEWALWVRNMGKDDDNGRVIYRDGNTSVAILKPARGETVQMRLAKILLPAYRRLEAVRGRLPRRKVAADA